jgi:hypothetical protein
LIGKNVDIYKNRILILEKNPMMKREPGSGGISIVRRYIGEVELKNYHFSPLNRAFPSLLTTLQNVGSRLNKLSIGTSEVGESYISPLVDVLLLANNVTELNLNKVQLYKQTKNVIYKKYSKKPTFGKLRSLNLTSVNINFIKEILSKINSLHHLPISPRKPNRWNILQPLLFQQKKLSSLALYWLEIKNFEWSELDLKKLTLRGVVFPRKEDFLGFTEFIKSLKNLTDLDLYISEEELNNKENNYTEILAHLQ